MMNTFDGSKPDLISSKTIKDIEANLDIPNGEDGNRVINGLGFFYNEYILPNMFPIIVIFLLIIYLTIKYILKKDREEREEEEEEKEIKRKRVKNQMLKVDPDTMVKSADKNNISNNSDNNNTGNINTDNNANKKSHRKNKKDISDMISDDYLITNDTEEDMINQNNEQNNIELTQFETQQLLDNREQVYDVDRAARMVFGQE